MGMSASNINNLSVPMSQVDNTRLEQESRDGLFNKIRALDKKDGAADGSIFTQAALNNPKLMNQYKKINELMDKYETVPQNREEYEALQQMKKEFAYELLKTDASDGNIDSSVINASEQDKQEIAQAENTSFSLLSLLRIAQGYDSSDDQKINGSIFKDEALMQYLDVLDDGKANQSAQNFLSEQINVETVVEGPDPYSTDNTEYPKSTKTYDESGLINGYNIFNPFDNLTGETSPELENSVDNVIKSNNGEKKVYNTQQYKEDQTPANPSVKVEDIKGKKVLTDAIKIALNELGVTEANGKHVKYGLSPDQPWCAAFTTWAVTKANGGTNIFKDKKGNNINRFSCGSIMNWAKGNNQKGKNIWSTDMKQAKVGDAIIFRDPKTGQDHTHIGIITKIENGKIYTIEGNTSDKVGERTYDMKSSKLQGVVKLNDYVA